MRKTLRRLDTALERALARFTVAILGEDGHPAPRALDPTGVAALDAALGGGLPRGRIAEVFGAPGCGKSTFALVLARAWQRRGQSVVWVDVERAFDAAFADALGVDLARLVVLRPRSGEQAFAALDALAARRAADLVIIDSVAALAPSAELAAPVGEAASGLHARLLSASLRRVHATLFDARCTLVCVNQTRFAFLEGGGRVLQTTGGQALSFYAATRLELAGTRDQLEIVVRKAAGDPMMHRVALEPGWVHPPMGEDLGNGLIERGDPTSANRRMPL